MRKRKDRNIKLPAGKYEFYRYGLSAQRYLQKSLIPNKLGFLSLKADSKFWKIGTSLGKYGEFAKIDGSYFPINNGGYLYAKVGSDKEIEFRKVIKSLLSSMCAYYIKMIGNNPELAKQRAIKRGVDIDIAKVEDKTISSVKISAANGKIKHKPKKAHIIKKVSVSKPKTDNIPDKANAKPAKEERKHMIRKYISDQLNKTTYCDFSNGYYTNDGYLVLNIPRYAKPTFDQGKSYAVRLDDSIMTKDCSLATNWNHGYAPIARELNIYVEKFMAGMIYVDATRYNPSHDFIPQDMWSGWLPINNLTLIK